MAKKIIKSSFGHIAKNATFTTRPQEETQNVTTVDDLSNKTRGLLETNE
jgi:hypothetical protein